MKPFCRKTTSSIKELFYLRWNESFKDFFGNVIYKRSTIFKPSDHLFTELSKNSTNPSFENSASATDGSSEAHSIPMFMIFKIPSIYL